MKRLEIEKLKLGSRIAQVVGKIVHKKNKRPTFRSISFKTFKGTTHFWRDMPAIMIEKTSLSLCLRKAYPVAFKGLYSQAELDQAKEE